MPQSFQCTSYHKDDGSYCSTLHCFHTGNPTYSMLCVTTRLFHILRLLGYSDKIDAAFSDSIAMNDDLVNNRILSMIRMTSALLMTHVCTYRSSMTNVKNNCMMTSAR